MQERPLGLINNRRKIKNFSCDLFSNFWQGWKKPGFFKKIQPSGFLKVFFWFFWVFWFFFGFFGFFCPDERVFRAFFSFTNTFRCIQTLNYNHLTNLPLSPNICISSWLSVDFISFWNILNWVHTVPYYFFENKR